MITDLKKTNDLVLQEVNNLKQVLAGNVGGIKVPVNAEQNNSQGKAMGVIRSMCRRLLNLHLLRSKS